LRLALTHALLLSMSIKSSSVSTISDCSSSPEDNVYYLAQSYIRSDHRDDKIPWKPYFTNTDLITSTAQATSIFPSVHTSDESNMSNQVSFLYDYYGMTEESRQDPPSPGHSSPASVDEKDIEGIDIPGRQVKSSDSPVLELSHSFPESSKTGYITSGINLPNESPPILTQRPHSASVPSVRKEEKGSSYETCLVRTSSTTGQSTDMQNTKFFSPFQRASYQESSKYMFILDAQTSVVQKRGENSLTYLNKGQFYNMSFEAKASKHKKVKSVIHLVFRCEKDEQTELNHWKYWYNQQPNPNQRAFDIDRKSCQNIDETIEEVGYNALAFKWNPNDQAKVSLRINCLSTDFSPQKGVRGIPLYFQIDTYEELSADLVHRSFCQIKVFRDKGAERKNKDESKTVGKRMVKYLKQGPDSSSPQTDLANVFQLGNKVTVLHSTSILSTKSVIFVPNDNCTPHTIVASKLSKSPSATVVTSPIATESPGGSFFTHYRERESKRGFNTALSNTKEDFENLDVYPKFKLPRVNRRKEPAVTVYVRKEEEKAYNALMLETFTLEELKSTLGNKYSIPAEMIKSIFKKTKKGILVNMDDQLVEQFVDEDDFLVNIDFDNHLGQFEVVLSC